MPSCSKPRFRERLLDAAASLWSATQVGVWCAGLCSIDDHSFADQTPSPRPNPDSIQHATAMLGYMRVLASDQLTDTWHSSIGRRSSLASGETLCIPEGLCDAPSELSCVDYRNAGSSLFKSSIACSQTTPLAEAGACRLRRHRTESTARSQRPRSSRGRFRNISMRWLKSRPRCAECARLSWTDWHSPLPPLSRGLRRR